MTVVPLLALGYAVYEAWGGALHWQDLLVFAIMYVPIGFGVTVGYHRLFTHRSFKPARALKIVPMGSKPRQCAHLRYWDSSHRCCSARSQFR